jgi:hypothetical protein
MFLSKRALFIGALGAMLVPMCGFANTVFSWSGSIGGVGIGGQAMFSTRVDNGGYELVIVLTNTSASAPPNSAAVLTGLYFDLTSSAANTSLGALGMESAEATGGLAGAGGYHVAMAGTAESNICAAGVGGTALSPSCDSTVAGGWEAAYYASGFGLAGDHYAIGTTGQSGVFQGNSSKAGQANYGIVPGGGVGLSDSANASLTNNFPYVYGTATFVLTGLASADFRIGNVVAAYGTQPEALLAAPGAATPEPGTAIELSAGVCLVAVSIWIKRRRGRSSD